MRGGFAGLPPRISTLASLADGVVRLALTEDREAAIQVARRRVGDEELHAVGVRPAIGHRELSAAIVRRTGPDLVRDHVARLPLTRADRIAALDHETLDHAMERGAVVGRALDPLALWSSATGATRARAR